MNSICSASLYSLSGRWIDANCSEQILTTSVTGITWSIPHVNFKDGTTHCIEHAVQSHSSLSISIKATEISMKVAQMSQRARAMFNQRLYRTAVSRVMDRNGRWRLQTGKTKRRAGFK